MPRAVRARFEFAPGFGLPELGGVIAGGLSGFGLQALWALLPLHGGADFGGRVFLFTLPVASSLLLTRQDPSGGSLLGQVRAARDFRRRPGRYLYEWTPPATAADDRQPLGRRLFSRHLGRVR